MNLLEALIVVRNGSLSSATARTRRGATARKVVDRKIQSLLRKKAWRESAPGSVPVHMGDEAFKYPIPEDVLTLALRALVDEATRATAEELSTPTRVRLIEALRVAKAELDLIPKDLPQS